MVLKAAVMSVACLLMVGMVGCFWFSAASAVRDISRDGVRVAGKVTGVVNPGGRGQSVTYSFPCGAGLTCSGTEDGNHYHGSNEVGDVVSVLYSKSHPSESTLDWAHLQKRPGELKIAVGLSVLLSVLPVGAVVGLTLRKRRASLESGV
jgi:hypothetical protein